MKIIHFDLSKKQRATYQHIEKLFPHRQTFHRISLSQCLYESTFDTLQIQVWDAESFRLQIFYWTWLRRCLIDSHRRRTALLLAARPWIGRVGSPSDKPTQVLILDFGLKKKSYGENKYRAQWHQETFKVARHIAAYCIFKIFIVHLIWWWEIFNWKFYFLIFAKNVYFVCMQV